MHLATAAKAKRRNHRTAFWGLIDNRLSLCNELTGGPDLVSMFPLSVRARCLSARQTDAFPRFTAYTSKITVTFWC